MRFILVSCTFIDSKLMAKLGRLGSSRTAFKATLALCTIIALAFSIPLPFASPRELRFGTSLVSSEQPSLRQSGLTQTGIRPNHAPRLQTARIDAITAAFQHAWNGYSKHCFGHDTLHPVSNTCEDDFGGYGATAIDSLPTAIIFGNEAAAFQILEFIATLYFKVVKGGTRIQVFEVTIRHFAAMVSAWDLLNGPFSHMVTNSDLRHALYAQMTILGDILSCAFDTPSGVPRDWVDPVSCQTDQATQNSIAGAGTMILEFARLSDITGNQTYVNLAQTAEEYLLKPQPASGEPYPGLLGSFISVESGEILGSKGSWGAFADCETLIRDHIVVIEH